MVRDKKTEHPHIVKTEGVVGGRPRIKDTRISVELIARYFKMGESPDDIFLMYPHLKPAAIYDAISYYLDHQEEMEREMAELDEELKDPESYMRKQGFERLPGGGFRPVRREVSSAD